MHCKFLMVVLTTMLLLGGCASLTQNTQTANTGKGISAAMPYDNLQDLLQQASQASSPQREQLQIQAAWQLVKRQDYQAANNLVSGIDGSLLAVPYQAQYALVKAALALHDGDTESVFSWLERQEVVTASNAEIAIQASIIKAQAFTTLQEYRAVVDEVSSITDHVPQDQSKAVYGLLWAALQHLDTPILDRIHKTAPASIQGWIALERIFRDSHDLYIQQAHYAQWKNAWPEHVAMDYPPILLQQLTTALSNMPQHIALLLPQTGRLAQAGNMIERGFVSAYFNAREQGAPIPDIKMYDSAVGDIRDVVRQAQHAGADIIIGPLDRVKVARIQSDDTLSVPVLTLNYAPLSSGVNPHVYQLGLAAEDEARQIAAFAMLKHYKKAAVLVPDSSKGVRIAKAFTQEFAQLGGSVTSEQHYSERKNFKNQIAHLLQLNRYHLARRPKHLNAYRNPNINMIFMYANPTNARLLKPILAYYLAGHVPVLAISTLYDSRSSVAQNRDLNGIVFPLTPWAEGVVPFKAVIQKSWGTGLNPSILYALGADAWMVYPYLNDVETDHRKMELYGNTGVLSLDENLRFHRQLNWFWFKEGKLVSQQYSALEKAND